MLLQRESQALISLRKHSGQVAPGRTAPLKEGKIVTKEDQAMKQYLPKLLLQTAVFLIHLQHMAGSFSSSRSVQALHTMSMICLVLVCLLTTEFATTDCKIKQLEKGEWHYCDKLSLLSHLSKPSLESILLLEQVRSEWTQWPVC